MKPLSSYKALGVRIDAVQIPDVIQLMDNWIEERTGCHTVALAGMYGVMQSQHDPSLKPIFNSADLVVPDGMPLVWLGRLRGLSMARRVYGPELMLEFCRHSASKGYRHFFFGGIPGVPELLSEILQTDFQGLQVAGTLSPSFHSPSPIEDDEIVSVINGTACDVLWVGLGSPKQDRWMYDHRQRLNVPVLVAVGAAFDMNSRTKKQAPRWMRESGLEWLFRLCQEPQRLWRRYLVDGSQFVLYVALELLGVKKFD